MLMLQLRECFQKQTNFPAGQVSPRFIFFEEKEDSPLCAASQNQRHSSEEKTTREEQGQFIDVTMAEVGKDEALAFLPIGDKLRFQKL
jgi:hypothetical protein